MTAPVSLIVNADDFGYCLPVSRGILEAIQAGAVTATGILANAPRLDEQLELVLGSAPGVDLGVHLNLTFGQPLSKELAGLFGPGAGFPGRNAMVARLLRGGIPLAAIEAEWRSQIERCIAAGVRPRFLNSHEHVHMLPPLYALTHRLARAYGIRQVRRVTPETLGARSPASLIRVGVMAALAALDRKAGSGPVPRLLGLAQSGRLDTGYFRRRFPTLKKGSYYELMCHPGYYDPADVPDPRLVRYHAWESELQSFLDESFHELCSRHGIRLIGYRHLEGAGTGTEEGAA